MSDHKDAPSIADALGHANTCEFAHCCGSPVLDISLIRSALRKAAAEGEAHRWVHLDEHVLPQDNHYYLVAYDDEQIGLAWYHSGDWLDSVADSSDGDRSFGGDVYAYAELPAPAPRDE
jgi:hypothetical protein